MTTQFRITLIVSSLFGALGSASGQGCSSPWVETGSPAGRHDAMMCFDSVRQETVMYGGYLPVAGAEQLDETWTRKTGGKWIRREVVGPPRRAFGAMAFDSARGVAVLFGGGTPPGAAGTPNGETWEWDGASWAQRMVSGPPARHQCAMAFDAARGVCVLFGGDPDFAQPLFGDTWEWNGTAWTNVTTAGPSARKQHAMTYDPVTQKVLLLGGQDGAGAISNDLWSFSGTQWTALPTAGTSRRMHEMQWDSQRAHAVVFGGRDTNGSLLGTTEIWNGAAWSTPATPVFPEARGQAMSAYDSVAGKVVLYGGDGPSALSDTWEYDTAWTLAAGPRPTPRIQSGMVFDSTRNRIVRFGGRTGIGPFGTNPPVDETWEYDGTSWSRVMPPSSPPPRIWPGLAYDSVRQRVVMFGGVGSTGNWLGDTWEYDGLTWSQSPAVGPPFHYGAIMAFDAVRGVTVLVRGTTTWEWDGSTWMQVMATVPSTNFSFPQGPGMSFDSVRGVCVLPCRSFGALAAAEYDGVKWSLRPRSSFVLGTGYCVGFDASLNATVLLAESNPTPTFNREVLAWNGLAWTRIGSTFFPTAGGYHFADGSFSFDPVRGSFVTFSGYNPPTATIMSQTDEYEIPRSPLLVTSLPTSSSSGPTQPAMFTVGAQGVGVTYQWRKNQVALSNGGPYSGVDGPTLTVAATHVANAFFDCILADACGATATVGPVTGTGLTSLTMDAPFGTPYTVRISVTSAFPNAHYFNAFSIDPLNVAAPGMGPWFGLFIALPDLINQYFLPVPPFNDYLDAGGSAVLVISGMHFLTGHTLGGATYITDATSGAFLGGAGPALLAIP
jgi:hypothetical protein